MLAVLFCLFLGAQAFPLEEERSSEFLRAATCGYEGCKCRRWCFGVTWQGKSLCDSPSGKSLGYTDYPGETLDSLRDRVPSVPDRWSGRFNLSCPKPQPGKLNVHIVPHTHDDVGWLKTVDQYYFGSKTMIQKAGVQYIIDSVIAELSHDPQKRFIYVETAFWWKWWMRQHDIVRHKVKQLVSNGQLEFIGGGWSMNDEAVTNYQSIIDQMTWGFRKLNDSFGECGRPKVGWQIDPFGHSREMASIFAQLGFDGLLFARLDYQDKRQRLTSKTAEFVWEGSANLGKSAHLFTSILYNHYSAPPGFCFDILCADEPFIDDKHSPDYNVDEKVKNFTKYAVNHAASYSSNNILVTMGEDFTYQDAHMWFVNLDKLIRYVNERNSSMNLFYSTPSCYLKALHDANMTWTTKQDDFFPYASDPHTYWTGYYTSRPTLKRYERLGNNYLQVCKQLYSLLDLGPEDWVDLNKMRHAMGVMQHHDAITGTEKEPVAYDYARILNEGFKECDIITETAINKIIDTKKNVDSAAPKVTLESCLLLNISQCNVSESSDNFVVTVYNPLSHSVSHYVRLPVNSATYMVQDPTGKSVKIQMVPVSQPVMEVPGRFSPATMELVFRAENLPPLGFRSYYISKTQHLDSQVQSRKMEQNGEDIKLEGLDGHIVLDGETGLLKSLVQQQKEIKVKQDFFYYKGYIGNNEEFANRSSGAYIFRPNGSDPVRISSGAKVLVYKGDIVEEAHQKFSDWVSQVIRYYKQENLIEMEWLVGPIPFQNNASKEVISRFSTDLLSNGVFYTDSNGREMLQRKRNFRPTWHLELEEPVSGNYYPVTSRISIRDETKNIEVAVLNDRAQGGSSLTDGQIELMVHRRLGHDDAFGVGEALNETAYGHGLVARGKHYLVAGNVKGTNETAAFKQRELSQRLLLDSWIFLSDAKQMTFQEWTSNYRMEFSGLKESLPANVHILTLEPWKGATYLLRLEHVFENNEDPVFSKPATVNLKELFSTFSIVSARETTLGGNQWLSDNHRFQWKIESNEVNASLEENTSAEDLDPFVVTLNPMQIRTFVIEIASKV